ncbi:gamma-glutamylcyclotransferase family protein [Natronohydrobacter thiooxidans]|jgi:hypothetical protein|uniref:gamma-glutamylcyclotransferase family protein n=1 Tax=Natronohydrobacter thiooxidans TaxID=87172 RepID=UPI0008FF1A54|nr:gamma-glutamylcyclotransferase family protein [Natronohydrobacter thiooxidans]
MNILISKPSFWLALIVLLLGIWLMISRAPVYLPRLDANAPPPPDEDSYVFGFATLANPLVRFIVIGRPVPAEPAQLRGWQRNRRDLRGEPSMVLDGVRFRVSPEEMVRLDRYERTGRRYRRDLMVLEDGTSAWVYRLKAAEGIEAVHD